jgi:oligogalacturonide lyase
MSYHDCREEPNVRFSPDKTMVFFTSNLFGASYVFGVEVKKAESPGAADVKDTAEPERRNPHIAK